MKKHIIIATLSLFVSLQTSQAQTKIGCSAGLNLSTIELNIPAFQHFHYRAGANFGLLFSRPLFQDLTLQLGIFYTRNCSKFREEIKNNNFSSCTNVDIQTDNLLLPVSLRYHFKITDQLTAYGLVGCYFTTRLNGSAQGKTADNRGYLNKIDVNFNNLAVKTNGGVIVGAGLEKKINHFLVFIELKYFYGLNNSYTPDAYLDISNLSAHPAMFMFSVGVSNLYLLPF